MKIACNFLLLIVVVLSSCSKEVKVSKNLNNTSIQGHWDVQAAFTIHYLNDTLWKTTVNNAPFEPTDPYRDLITADLTKDSVFFVNADGTKSKHSYQFVNDKLVLHFSDSLPCKFLDRTMSLQRVKKYSDLGGRHCDTLNYTLLKN